MILVSDRGLLTHSSGYRYEMEWNKCVECWVARARITRNDTIFSARVIGFLRMKNMSEKLLYRLVRHGCAQNLLILLQIKLAFATVQFFAL